MPVEYTVKPVATVRSTRSSPTDDHWGKETATIVLYDSFPLDSLEGIDAFSHLEILFLFDKVAEAAICVGARHPRGNVNYPPTGIFAQRAKSRPNRIGASFVRLLSRQGRTLTVAGLDAIDGTPVLDIKPVFREFLPKEEIRQPKWVTELLREYW